MREQQWQRLCFVVVAPRRGEWHVAFADDTCSASKWLSGAVGRSDWDRSGVMDYLLDVAPVVVDPHK